MQVKLLHDLVEELAGVDTGRIVEILFGKKDVNEFLIAKKMDLTINQVRNILYKLSVDGLVSFIRKKDKRKGWYIYYWTLKTEKCLVKLEQSLVKKIEEYNSILRNRETKRFYVCNSCDIEVSEEKALEHGFTCEECADVYELSDNQGPIKDTKSAISRIEKNLNLIRGELESLREKERKKRARADKKVAKELAEKKALLKVARVAARKKIASSKGGPGRARTKKVVKAPKGVPRARKASSKRTSSAKKKAKKVVKKKIKKAIKKKISKRK